MIRRAAILSIVVWLMPTLAAGDCSGTGSGPCARIELWADASCTVCNLEVPLGQTSTFHITASLDGMYGISGAELRVVGLPDEWLVVSTPNPIASLTLGDPLGAGANIGFPTGQFGGCVLLYEVSVTPLAPELSAQLAIVPHSSPANPNFPCPVITPDCGPCFTAYCAEPGAMTINGSCFVAVERLTFGRVKMLYR
jgi:hypothetical protein